MKYLVRILLVLLFIPVMTLWFIGVLVSMWISVFQIPIMFIGWGHVYIEDILIYWYLDHGLDPVVFVENKLKEKNLL